MKVGKTKEKRTAKQEFILSKMAEHGDDHLEREQVLRLTAEDAALLLGLLYNPPKPNPALIRAFAHRR